MFLEMLMFFGSGILGALVNHALSPSIRRTTGLALTTWVVCISYEVLAFSLPFRAVWSELLCALAGIMAVVVVMIFLPIGEDYPRATSQAAGCACAITILFWPIVVFTAVDRTHQARQMAEELNGLVYEKYRGGHGVPSIIVLAADYSSAELEGIDPTTWNAMVTGKSQIHKPAWSAFGTLDGKRVRILPHGRFPD
jgi:hypothetical protein